MDQNIEFRNFFTMKVKTTHRTEFVSSKQDLTEVYASSGLKYKTSMYALLKKRWGRSNGL